MLLQNEKNTCGLFYSKLPNRALCDHDFLITAAMANQTQGFLAETRHNLVSAT